MDAKAYDPKTAAFAGWVIQNIPSLTDAEMNHWMGNPDGTKQILAAFRKTGCPQLEKEQEKPAKPKLLSVVATTALAAMNGKETAACFTGSRWCHRDSDFDRWLPKDQPNADACTIATLAPSREWTFREVAVEITGLPVTASTKDLGRALIKSGHTMTLAQAEEMVEAIERGDSTGMRTDGWSNGFFVETGDKNDLLSVGSVGCGGRGWGAGVDRLAYDDRWRAGFRLLLRNLDASKLRT